MTSKVMIIEIFLTNLQLRFWIFFHWDEKAKIHMVAGNYYQHCATSFLQFSLFAHKTEQQRVYCTIPCNACLLQTIDKDMKWPSIKELKQHKNIYHKNHKKQKTYLCIFQHNSVICRIYLSISISISISTSIDLYI